MMRIMARMTKAACVRVRVSKSLPGAGNGQPAEGALYDPTLGQHVEALRRVGALDDLERYACLGLDSRRSRLALIAAVSHGALQGRHSAVAVFSRMGATSRSW